MRDVLSFAVLVFSTANSVAQHAAASTSVAPAPSVATRAPEGACTCFYFNPDTKVVALSGFEPVTYGTMVKKGGRVKFHCRNFEFYVLEGPPELVCDSCRDWKTSEFPLCKKKSVNLTGDVEINLREGQDIVVSCESLRWDLGYPIWEVPQSTLPDAIAFQDIPKKDFPNAVKLMRIFSADVRHEGVYHCRLKDHRTRTLKIRVTYPCSIPSVPNGKLNEYKNFRENKLLHEVRVGSKLESNKKLFLSCDEGYEPLGKPEKLAIVKCSNGIWTDVPKCKPGSPLLGCPRPEMNPKAYIDGNLVDSGEDDPDTYVYGSSVRFLCKEGFQLIGEDVLHCLETGSWNKPPPVCKRETAGSPLLGCPRPEMDPNAYIDGNLVDSCEDDPDTYVYGSSVRFLCKDGFQLIGEDVLYCLSTGNWNKPAPVCERNTTGIIYCVNVEFIDHGHVDVYGASSNWSRVQLNESHYFNQMYLPETQIHYRCNEGYHIKGSEILVCDPFGDWSDNAPTCVPGSPPLSCPRPDMDPNAYIENIEDFDYTLIDPRFVGDDPDSYVSGSSVRFQCKNGFQLSDEDVLFCLNTGSWNKPAPVCERKPAGIIYCANVEFIAHGHVDVYRASSNYNPVQLNESHSDQMYPPKTELHYGCNEGYHIKGSEILVCEPFGDWSDEAPTCVPEIQCPALVIRHGGLIADLPKDARRIPKRNRYPKKTTLTVTCNTGYVLRGSQILNCTPSGLWSEEPPVCVEDCGVSPLSAKKRIAYGRPTQAGEWPWMVAISELGGGRPKLICGGALLDARTVLTAAHCVSRQSYYLLQFGKLNRSNTADDDRVVARQSSDIVIHPRYVSGTFENDIALVRLNINVPYSDRILPICLPSPETTKENLQPGNKGYLAGWGMNEMDVQPSELMMGRLSVVSATDCEDNKRRQGVNVSVGASRFCAGSRQARRPNACRGDSGSPLVFPRDVTGKFTAEGIVSHSASGECARTGRITLFMKIDYYMDWIHENWKRTEP